MTTDRETRLGHDHRRLRQKLVGAVLAGGKGTRFGADKAMAMLEGRPLVYHAIETLRSLTNLTVVVGRNIDGFECVDDLPASGLGPLGGLCGALDYAGRHGFDGVLSTGCDIPHLPPQSATLLVGQGPACNADLPIIGYWPVSLAGPLLDYLISDSKRSMYGWAEAIGCKMVRFREKIENVNSLAELERIAAQRLSDR
ncbi:MAG: NTP transferase domain-containing protein [Parasphingopyxis sp.]|uniref:NTP transferase domain-containing protein n=1 Tax=Parasphingopyxis sp. TaxID=1920299 RepID=UPI0032EF8729